MALRKLDALNLRDVNHLCKHLHTNPKELRAICRTIRRRPGEYYHQFSRVRNGKRRDHAKPVRRLRQIVDALKTLLNRVRLADCLHGGIKDRSARTNAAPHVGKPMLVKFDIEDFFPNITNRMVYHMFVQRLGCSPEVARCLTRLTTLNGCLPQGSPTSTVVANLVIEPLALRIEGLARQHGAAYRQFVDDGAISGPNHLSELVPLIKRIVAQEGFRTKDEKTYCVGASQEQVVTGCRVNRQLDIPSEKFREVRELMKSLSEDIEKSHILDHKRLASLEGKIRHVARINKGAGRFLQREYRRLLATLPKHRGERFTLKLR